jgi:hypothetical protein
MMDWITGGAVSFPTIIVLGLLAAYILSERVGPTMVEGFATPLRSDIGYAADGWAEPAPWIRDLRYKETFVDIQGLGTASDFCRAIYKKSDPESLRISCAMGRRDGMDTMEYNSRTKCRGFRFSRDDYWRKRKGCKTNRADYCRILKDEVTGERIPMCAIAGPTGFKDKDECDSEPPTAILELLEAYEGILVWFRWRDDRIDYAENAAFTVFGRPVFPTLLNPTVSRGLQLNRWSAAAQAAGDPAPPLQDYLRWGETGTLELHQAIPPRQIRAIAFWVWFDTLEKGTMILDCANQAVHVRKQDKILLGVEGGGSLVAPVKITTKAAQEVRSEVIQAIKPQTEPAIPPPALLTDAAGRYFFEVWDEESRLMRLEAPMSSARTGVWQHVAVTVTSSEDWWPTWTMWIDGIKAAEKVDGRLSPAMEIRENYIGRNLRGCIQDFRMYNTQITMQKLEAMIQYSKGRLHPLP